MDFGDIFKQRMAAATHAANLNAALATMETDFSNPMTFDQTARKNMDRQQFTDMEPEERGLWQIVYPCYFDSEKTLAEGRRMGKELCVPNCNFHQLTFAIQHLGIPVKAEIVAKHPRDHFGHGRIRFRLKDANGVLANPEISTKKQLFRAIGSDWQPALEKYEAELSKQKIEVERRKEEVKKAQEAAGMKPPAEVKEGQESGSSKKDKKKKKKK